MLAREKSCKYFVFSFLPSGGGTYKDELLTTIILKTEHRSVGIGIGKERKKAHE
jgi:hypothetical protein